MGSEYMRDQEKGALDIAQTQFIRSVLSLFDCLEVQLHPRDPFLGHQARTRRGDVPFREIVGSLMWIAKQTRPDIANAVRAIARFSHDPKSIHYEAAQKMRVYLNATS